MTQETEQIDSHIKARDFFNATSDLYKKRIESEILSFSTLMFRRRQDIVEYFLDRFPAATKVLDYGMGPAVFGNKCQAKGLHYVGIDISEKMVKLAELKKLKNAEFIVGDLDCLKPFRSQMDAVLAIGLIDYLEEPFAGIQKLSDCVKPQGSLMLSFSNRYSIPWLSRVLAKKIWRLFTPPKKSSSKAFLSDVHEHSFDFEVHLKPHLQALSYTEFEVLYYNCSPFFFNFPLAPALWKSWRILDARLSSRFTRFSCSAGVLIAKKGKIQP